MFAKSFAGVGIRILVALGLATVTVAPGGREVITIHPVVAAIAVILNVILWVSVVGSFIIATIALVRHW